MSLLNFNLNLILQLTSPGLIRMAAYHVQIIGKSSHSNYLIPTQGVSAILIPRLPPLPQHPFLSLLLYPKWGRLLKNGDVVAPAENAVALHHISTQPRLRQSPYDESSGECYRDMFYSLDKGLVSRNWGPVLENTDGLIGMDTILCESPNKALSAIDKLKVARSLALTVLRFHTTSWLTEAWRLQDICLFHRGEDLSQSLQTLHLKFEFD